jgi:hypothetical protein
MSYNLVFNFTTFRPLVVGRQFDGDTANFTVRGSNVEAIPVPGKEGCEGIICDFCGRVYYLF